MEKREVIRWEAHEYEHHEKSDAWYVALGILAIGGSIASFILGNILFGIFILAAAFAMALFAAKPPSQHSFAITRKGIAIGTRLYPWTTLESFWIIEEHEPAHILLKSSRFFMPLIVIPLANELDPEMIHERLSEHLHEEELHEPFSDRLLAMTGW